jgi:hypothetical protein
VKENRMNTHILSDIKVLDNLLALNLNISLWSARKKMTTEDFHGAALPPDDLASLGSKRIADPNSLKIFGTLKARVFTYLDRQGIRFLGGWAIPEEKAEEILNELTAIRTDFLAEKENFLSGYDASIQAWIAQHSEWASIIQSSTVSADYVRARMGFSWQLYKVAPMEGTHIETGLDREVTGLAQTLFGEVARSADDIWNKVYMGKTEVTHKALSPLKTIHQKLMGLTFINPHVTPVISIIEMAFNRLPAKGNINGADLVMLQGLVNLLRDPDALITHAEKVLAGYGPATVLDMVTQVSSAQLPSGDTSLSPTDDLPAFIPTNIHANLPNVGLW